MADKIYRTRFFFDWKVERLQGTHHQTWCRKNLDGSIEAVYHNPDTDEKIEIVYRPWGRPKK